MLWGFRYRLLTELEGNSNSAVPSRSLQAPLKIFVVPAGAEPKVQQHVEGTLNQGAHEEAGHQEPEENEDEQPGTLEGQAEYILRNKDKRRAKEIQKSEREEGEEEHQNRRETRSPHRAVLTRHLMSGQLGGICPKRTRTEI